MKTIKLDSIIKLEYGKPLPLEDRSVKGNYPAYGANGVKVRTNKYYHDKPSIIVGRKGSAGELTLTEGKFWPLDVTYFLTHDEKETDLIYLYYLLKTLNLPSFARGVKPGINRNDIYSIQVVLPPLEEQRRVVERLDAAFEKIDQAIGLSKINTANGVTLLSKLIEQNIEKAKKYPELAMGDVCEFVRGPFGGSLKKESFRPTGYAVYEQRHAIYSDFSSVRYHIDESKFNEMKRFEVKPGDIIMSCSGTMGKTAIIPPDAHAGIINQALLKLSPKTPQIFTPFIKYWMESRTFQNLIGLNSGGAAIKNVSSVKILKSIPMSLPPIDVQKELANEINKLQCKQKAFSHLHSQKLNMLNALKQSLLRQAFEQGEVE